MKARTMKFAVEEISCTEKKINIEYPYDEVQKILNSKYNKLKKKVKLKGFRPGKAPRFMLERFYGQQVKQETLQELMEESIPEALEENDIKPLAQLEYTFEETNFNEEEPIKFSAIVEVSPEFSIDGYRNLQLRKESFEVSDEEIEEKLQELREHNAYLETVESPPPVKEDDFVVIDFETNIDGKISKELSSSDFSLEIGKNIIHKDFDTHMLGMTPGEEKTFKIVYPPETPNRELAGKEVEFKVTLKEVKEKILPELDDEFAKDLGPFSDLEEVREKVREELTEAKKARSENQLRDDLYGQLNDLATFDIPQRAVKREIELMIEQFKKELKSRNLTLEDIHSSEKVLEKNYQDEAEKRVRFFLILQKIAELEGIKEEAGGKGSVNQRTIEKLIEWANITEVPEGTFEKEKTQQLQEDSKESRESEDQQSTKEEDVPEPAVQE